MEKDCKTCAYAKGKSCKVMTKQIKNCFAWADKQEMQKREDACAEYMLKFGTEYGLAVTKMSDETRIKRNKARELNEKLRGGKSAKETVAMYFYELYTLGLSDSQIAKELHVADNVVGNHRRAKGLEPNKRRPHHCNGNGQRSNKGLKEMHA